MKPADSMSSPNAAKAADSQSKGRHPHFPVPSPFTRSDRPAVTAPITIRSAPRYVGK